MDIKLVFAVLAFVLVIGAMVSYIRGMLRGTNKPHAYTWLIWTVTGGIATAALMYGEGGLPVYTSAINTTLCLAVFLLSSRFGTRDITRGDALTLAVAVLAIYFWTGLHQPLWSAILGISIDLIGYWPTFRKSYAAPWDESLASWLMWLVAPTLSILALASYNVFTLINFAPITFVNGLFILFLLLRRRAVPKPADILKQ